MIIDKLTPQIERLISFFDFDEIERFNQDTKLLAKLTDAKIYFELTVYGSKKGRRIDIEGYSIFSMESTGELDTESIDSVIKGKIFFDYPSEKIGYQKEILSSLIDITNLDKDMIIACLSNI